MIDQKGPVHYWPWYPWTESPRLYRKVNEHTMESKTVSSIPQCFLLLFLLPDSKFDFLHWLPFIINYEWKMKTINQIPFLQQVVFDQCFTTAIEIKTGQKFILIAQSSELCWFLVLAQTLISIFHRPLCVFHSFRITLLCYLVMYNYRFPLVAFHETQVPLSSRKTSSSIEWLLFSAYPWEVNFVLIFLKKYFILLIFKMGSWFYFFHIFYFEICA